MLDAWAMTIDEAMEFYERCEKFKADTVEKRKAILRGMIEERRNVIRGKINIPEIEKGMREGKQIFGVKLRRDVNDSNGNIGDGR